jgi:hypothetical protein
MEDYKLEGCIKKVYWCINKKIEIKVKIKIKEVS